MNGTILCVEMFTEQYQAWQNGETAPKFIVKKFWGSKATFYRKVKEFEKTMELHLKTGENSNEKTFCIVDCFAINYENILKFIK